MPTTISLYGIEESLHSLMDALEEIPMDAELTEQERADELSIITTTLQDYCRQEVQKVDGVRAYLKHCQAMALAAKAEESAMAQRRKTWEAREERLKQYVMSAMDVAGKKKIEGHTGTLSIRNNGGVVPLVLDNPTLIPDDYCMYEGKIPGSVYRVVADDPAIQQFFKKIPSVTSIRAALDEDCERCEGNGVREESLDATHPFHEPAENPCKACGGTGKRGVPGAHLAERGRHVEVK